MRTAITADAATAAEQLERLQAPDVAELDEVYEDRPASLGVICARLIPVADTEDGEAAVAALAGGSAFADVAQQYSVDPAVVEADGWLDRGPREPVRTAHRPAVRRRARRTRSSTPLRGNRSGRWCSSARRET